jgi:steroid 5-alpha reductase family enzyme
MAESSSSEQRQARRAVGLSVVALAYLAGLAVALAVGWALRGRAPLLITAAADAAGTATVFAFSVSCNNSSLYDPYWSLAPIPIAVYWLSLWHGAVGPRQVLVLAFVCVWGLRLTANWVARWRGLSDEDFRYAEIRAKTGRGYWPASFVAIHLMPTIWVLLGLLPLFPALSTSARPFGWLDGTGAVITAAAIAIEAIADLQLRAFLRGRGDPREVLRTGLWGVCRHPNYLGEMTFWWGLYLFGVAADPRWAWSLVGPLSITVLFISVSVPWMDRRMLARHPAWAECMRTSPALIPFTKSR